MTDRVVDDDGRTWVTTARGAAELNGTRPDRDITEALIRDWTRRGLVERHIHDRRAWYNLAELQRVEAATCDRTRPRNPVLDEESPARSQSHATGQRQNYAQATA